MRALPSVDSLEFQAVRSVLGAFLGTVPDEGAAAVLARGPDWEAVQALAARERVEGLLAAECLRLSEACGLAVPAEALRARARSLFVASSELMRELDAVLRAFSERGLPVMVLKGAALVASAYRGRAGLRPMQDVDLLVRVEDRAAAGALLEELGFRGPGMLHRKGWVKVDLHTDPLGGERIRLRNAVYRFQEEEIWARSRPLASDAAVRVPCPVDHALMLAVHALKHSFNKLIWLVDLGLVLPEVEEPELLLARARAARAHRALACCAVLLERLFGAGAPLPGLPRLNLVEHLFVEAAALRRHPSSMGVLVTAFAAPDARTATAYLWECLFPRREVLEAMLPGTPSWALYPRRALQLLGLARKEMRDGRRGK